MARAAGLKVGTLRLNTAWPFPEKEMRAAAESADFVLVLENNVGQMYPYIKAESAARLQGRFPADRRFSGRSTTRSIYWKRSGRL